MVIGFVVWSLVCAVMIGIGIADYHAKEAVGFWTGTQPPEVKDVKKYNHACGIMWIIYGLVLEGVGVPLIFLTENSAQLVWLIFGALAATGGLMVAYVFIERKWKVE